MIGTISGSVGTRRSAAVLLALNTQKRIKRTLIEIRFFSSPLLLLFWQKQSAQTLLLSNYYHRYLPHRKTGWLFSFISRPLAIRYVLCIVIDTCTVAHHHNNITDLVFSAVLSVLLFEIFVSKTTLRCRRRFRNNHCHPWIHIFNILHF